MIQQWMREKLENPYHVLIGVDFDGTLCKGDIWGRPGEVEPEPVKEMIEFMWKLYFAGAHLIIYTARQPRQYPSTHAWLIKHEVPFHGIAMTMKPGADIYIDDKSLNISDLKELLK